MTSIYFLLQLISGSYLDLEEENILENETYAGFLQQLIEEDNYSIFEVIDMKLSIFFIEHIKFQLK